jgi:hypothetical protein
MCEKTRKTDFENFLLNFVEFNLKNFSIGKYFSHNNKAVNV